MTDTSFEAFHVLGSVGVREMALVDSGGGVGPSGAGWRVQWLVRSEERWHEPAEQVSTRQELEDGASTVITRVRVPSGDIVGTVWVGLDDHARPHARLEIANSTTVPVGIAVVVRGGDVSGSARAGSVEASLDGIRLGDDRVVAFGREPRALVAAHDFASLAEALDSDHAAADVATAGSDDGLAACAAVFPVAHGAALSVSVALRRGTTASSPDALPTADEVSRGWDAHLDRGVRLVTGDDPVDASLHRARQQLLVAAGDGVPGSWPDLDSVAHAQLRGAVGAALAQWGFDAEARSVRDALTIDLDDGDVSVASAWLLAAEASRRLAGGDPPATELIAMAVATIDTASRRPRRRPRGCSGLVHAAASTEPWAPRHSVWGIVGLACAAASLAGHGQATAADEVGKRAQSLARCWSDATPPADPSRTLMAVLAAWVNPDGVAADPAPVLPLETSDPLTATVALLALPRRFVEVSHDGFDIVAPPVPGANWEVHDLPSIHGPISVAVRWHGERPALLWEHQAAQLSARSIDPSWSDANPAGEALLGVSSR